MKKLFLIWLLFLCSFTLTWCFGNWSNGNSLLWRLWWFDIKDWPGMERDDNTEWWERITIVTEMCEEQWWNTEEWNEWWERQDVCYFDDKTFCYLEDFAAWKCKKWDMSYINDWYTYAEEACIDNNGQISQTEEWEDICILSDEEFCYMRDVMDWGCDLLYQDMLDIQDMHESERAYQEYIAECYEQPQVTVCGQDGNPYYNRCFMEKAGVQEETELAEVVDGECIYG